MNITQTYQNDFSHSRHTVGTPKDYPIDDNCGATGPNGYFYCPSDAMIVKKIYGVGTSSTNVLWLESTTPVITPTFTDYVTIMVGHIEDSELNKLKVGQVFTRKERIAKGCGKDIAAVNRLLKQFEESKKMMSMLGNFDPNTGMPTHGIKSKNPHVGNANRKKVRHKKKKKK